MDGRFDGLYATGDLDFLADHANRTRRSVSYAGQYNLDAGDNDFEDILESSQKVYADRTKLKRKRDSSSPKIGSARPLRSRLQNGSRPMDDSSTNDDQSDKYFASELSDSRNRADAENSDTNHAHNTSLIVKLSIPRSRVKSELPQPTEEVASYNSASRQESEPLVSSELSGSEHGGNHENTRDRGPQVAPPTHESDAVDGGIITQNGDEGSPSQDEKPRRSLRKGRRSVVESDEYDSSEQDTQTLGKLPPKRTPAMNERKIDPDEEEYVELSEDADEQEVMTDDLSTPSRDDMHDFIEEDDGDGAKRSRGRRHSTRRPRRSRPLRKSNRVSRRVLDSEDDHGELDSHDELQAELNDIRPPIREERRRQLRDRTNRPDYAIPPPLTTDQILTATASSSRKREPIMRNSFRNLYPEYSSLGLGLSIDGQQTFGNFGPPVGLQSDSDSSDEEGQTSRSTSKNVAKSLLPRMQHRDQPATGGSNSLGKVKGASLADADPIEIDKEANFSSVGGLTDHIDQLKEMVSLPLLYPEIFQRFHITPPRGVLFHGPPGTGKTLMARALAASCSSEGRKIAFYMRKGADCLSKWVGEAERQLRLLFDEARNNQPSIIFFDEIDGLAPVRSAKQDQIHASIVSTLLALMDGMDARGQVVVIGATNRPDSVDPALRRPGRFDREFYFPLPSLEARKHILQIHTSKWDPPLEGQFISELAVQTKGYGGADLRALCTESALNAVQRRYPQIYQSSQKLVIDPTTIRVSPRDFMVAMKKLVPSSTRSTSSSALALPTHMQPLLEGSLRKAIQAIDILIPRKRKTTALEENMLCEEDESTFEKESLRQMLDNMRVYRPRLLISGKAGSGQLHLGRAILHHLEGFHVQVLDLTTIYGDSAITAEASLIQTFVEAKRHMPSVLFMPAVDLWFGSASSSVVSIFRSMLSTMAASDQLVLLGIASSDRSELVHEISDLFGNSDMTNLVIGQPSAEERYNFFSFLASLITKSPAELPDTRTERRRELETLAIAPPAPPRDLSKAERKAIETKDRKIKLVLKVKLGPLMELIRSRYKRFKKPTLDEKDIAHLLIENGLDIPDDLGDRDYEKTADGMILEKSTGKKFYNMDINLIEERLWNNLYLTPKQFQNDIEQILHDAQQEDCDRERVLKAQELHTNVLIHLEDMFDVEFLEECKAMALREIERHRRYVEHKREVLAAANADHADRTNEQGRDLSQPQVESQGLDSTRQTLDLQLVIENTPTDSTTDLQKARLAKGPMDNGEESTDVKNATLERVNDIEMVDAGLTQVAEDRANTNGVLNGVVPAVNGHDAGLNLHSAVENPMSNGTRQHESHGIDAAHDTAHDAAHDTARNTAKVNEPAQEDDHPPFELDVLALEHRHRSWVNMTSHLDIEQLEQMNALVIDAIWEHRFEWNRNKVAEIVDASMLNLRQIA